VAIAHRPSPIVDSALAVPAQAPDGHLYLAEIAVGRVRAYRAYPAVQNTVLNLGEEMLHVLGGDAQDRRESARLGSTGRMFGRQRVGGELVPDAEGEWVIEVARTVSRANLAASAREASAAG
jgi:hypothetical protein